MDEKFKLPGSSFEQLLRIIRAYGQVTDNASPGDVAKVLGVDRTEVSRNNGFLVSVGILEGGQKKSLSQKGRALARALEYDIDVPARWREIVAESDFLQRVLAAVRIRNGMEHSSLRAHIAYSAGQSKTASVMAGTGAVIRILEEAGLLDEDSGKLIALSEPREAQSEAAPPARPVEDWLGSESEGQIESRERAPAGTRSSPPVATVSIQFNINITATPEDLALLEASLAHVVSRLRDVSGSEPEE